MENSKYNPHKIESKWQKIWAEKGLYKTLDNSKKPKFYVLDMFPYPSGAGLHVGHVESYTATDIYARYLRMKGFNVLHPQGFDAFGLPAENYAVKTGVHPKKTTKEAIETFKRQINSMGFSYDWSREVISSDPEYYRWTQWFFLLLYKNKLAYKKKAKVNWCPKCQTVLANEQAEGGKCDRCESEVVQKDLEQWFFKITDFVEDKDVSSKVSSKVHTSGLLSGLDKIDWPESTKSLQKNWIGRSEGTIIKFQIICNGSSTSIMEVELPKEIEVFTTRVDTIFGCTYCVAAPEHKIILELKDQIENFGEVEKYIKATKKKTDLDRMEAKEKTGVELKGIKVVNPFNGEAMPLYAADYVLSQYGTGAVMAVPAHDERDWEFAKKYNLPIKEVVMPVFGELHEGAVKRETISPIIQRESDGKFLFLKMKKELNGIVTTIIGGIEKGESIEEAAIRETLEETGYKTKFIKTLGGKLESHFYAPHKKVWRERIDQPVILKLVDENKTEEISDKEKELQEAIWLTEEEIYKKAIYESDILRINRFLGKETAYVNDGRVVNSEKYSGLSSEQAREEMTQWLSENKLGGKKVNYRLRDWLVSRQRYWGAPIPIIYCEKCARLHQGFGGQGEWPVPEKDLPVMLPDDVDFKPTGESPLKYSKKFQNVKCPKCGSNAKRESDTMDTFVCSSWYYLRYADPKNEKEFASKELIKKWLPVDLYVGGAEHSVLHLLYARFFTKVLHNLGYIDFDEPFLKLRHQGIILAEDGTKMSKSKGNIVNPDDVAKQFGADALRMFEMFMGPLEDMKPWQTKGIIGLYRFLERVWKLNDKFPMTNDKSHAYRQAGISNDKCQNKKLNSLIHKTIKKVSEDIENFHFNTAISQLMILVNALEKEKEIAVGDYKTFLILLSPFAPHIAEELWNKLGNPSAGEAGKKSIFLESWPEYDPKFIKDEEIELVIQINGKVRDKIKTGADISEEEAKKLAQENKKIKNYLGDKKIRKIIFIKGKLVNIVA